MNLESRVHILDNSARITIVNGPVLLSRGLYKRRNKGSWKDIVMKITILKGQYAEILTCSRHLKYSSNQNISFGHVRQASVNSGLPVFVLFIVG